MNAFTFEFETDARFSLPGVPLKSRVTLFAADAKQAINKFRRMTDDLPFQITSNASQSGAYVNP